MPSPARLPPGHTQEQQDHPPERVEHRLEGVHELPRAWILEDDPAILRVVRVLADQGLIGSRLQLELEQPALGVVKRALDGVPRGLDQAGWVDGR